MSGNNQCDVVVVGAGAAGCSAALYATRYNMKVLMLGGPMPGGLITEALDVENYPGIYSISGQKLAQDFIDHAIKLGAEYKVEIASEIEEHEGQYKITTGQVAYFAKTVILATGTHHKKLGVLGEQEFSGRGVSYCSTCDAIFFKDKIVAVVGGGNSAVEGASDLSRHAKVVYIIYRSKLTATPFYVERLRTRPNVVEIPKTNVLEIKGEEIVTSVNLDKEFDGSKGLSVDGVFIQIGYIPENELAKALQLDLTDKGYVKVDAGMGTSLNGVFCAGDLNNASNYLRQQVTSAAEGAIAAQSAYRFIRGIDYLIV